MCSGKIKNHGGCCLGKPCGRKKLQLDCVGFGNDYNGWISVFRCCWLKQVLSTSFAGEVVGRSTVNKGYKCGGRLPLKS